MALKVNFTPAFGDNTISYKFTAIEDTIGAKEYYWYLRYSIDEGKTWENPILLSKTRANNFSKILTSIDLPYDSYYKIGVSTTSSLSKINYSEPKYFYSDITKINFPHLIISDAIDSYAKVSDGYFRKKIHFIWNKQGLNTNFYLVEKQERKITDKLSKFLVFEEKFINFFTLLKHLPKISYEIYYKQNGILKDRPIAKGKITSGNIFLEDEYDFSDIPGNDRISLVLKIYDIEEDSRQEIVLDNNNYLIKARNPYLDVNNIQILYGLNGANSFHPLQINDSFTINFPNPVLYNNAQATSLSWQVRIGKLTNPPILEGNYSNPQGSTLLARIVATEEVKNQISFSLTQSTEDPNSLFRKPSMFFSLQDQYGLIENYAIPANKLIDIDFREAPRFSSSTFQIGVDCLPPENNNITWLAADILANKSSEKIVNSDNYILSIFSPATDLNLNDKVFYKVSLLVSSDKLNYEEITSSFWTNLDSNNAHSSNYLLNGVKYGLPNLKVAFLKLPQLIQKKYYKTTIQAFNIENEDFSKKIIGDKITSETYLVGCPTPLPILTFNKSPLLKNNIASTLDSGKCIYSVGMPPNYDKYPSFEKSIQCKFNGTDYIYNPSAQLILQYSLTNQILENDENKEEIIVKSSFTNHQLETNLTRSILEQGFSRIFFRIKLIITTGIYYDSLENKIKTKTETCYSNVVLYYADGPTILQRPHSIAINQGEPLAKEVFVINPFGEKTIVKMTGRNSKDSNNIKDTSIIFNLDNGILAVDNESNFDFITTNADIEAMFSSQI